MFILYAIVLGFVLGYATGGRLKWLTHHPLRNKELTILAFAIQLIIFNDWINIPNRLVILLHLLSYALLLTFALMNIRIKGIMPITLGIFLNALVIFLNGGYMPAATDNVGSTSMAKYAEALYEGGLTQNSTGITEGTRLPWLADIFVLPSWLPLSNIFSIGDVLIALGICIYIVFNMRPPIGVIRRPT